MDIKKFISITKFYSTILFVIFLFIFMNNCGIEDSFYFQEPINLKVDNVNQAANIVRFTAYNQEEDSGNYLLIGYDVYYYFGGNESSAKKAAVKIPIVNFSLSPLTNLIDFTKGNVKPYGTGSDDDLIRFSKFIDVYGNPNTNDLYNIFTIPVTHKMIDEILYEGNNDNVELYFHNIDFIENEPYLVPDYGCNPKIDSTEKSIKIENIYPDYFSYKDEVWADADFLGFYDYDFYKYNGIAYNYESIGKYYYVANMYVIARGFSSGTYDKDFISSIKSNTITVIFEVDPIATEYIP
ncbi:MAG: hypothetical protein JXB50_13205 [Spirochaetes bacterium]|nr:hypothetical protein [Spirochaetota bacterium]